MDQWCTTNKNTETLSNEKKNNNNEEEKRNLKWVLKLFFTKNTILNFLYSQYLPKLNETKKRTDSLLFYSNEVFFETSKIIAAPNWYLSICLSEQIPPLYFSFHRCSSEAEITVATERTSLVAICRIKYWKKNFLLTQQLFHWSV